MPAAHTPNAMYVPSYTGSFSSAVQLECAQYVPKNEELLVSRRNGLVPPVVFPGEKMMP